jgi:hypothetical protein
MAPSDWWALRAPPGPERLLPTNVITFVCRDAGLRPSAPPSFLSSSAGRCHGAGDLGIELVPSPRALGASGAYHPGARGRSITSGAWTQGTISQSQNRSVSAFPAALRHPLF